MKSKRLKQKTAIESAFSMKIPKDRTIVIIVPNAVPSALATVSSKWMSCEPLAYQWLRSAYFFWNVVTQTPGQIGPANFQIKRLEKGAVHRMPKLLEWLRKNQNHPGIIRMIGSVSYTHLTLPTKA